MKGKETIRLRPSSETLDSDLGCLLARCLCGNRKKRGVLVLAAIFVVIATWMLMFSHLVLQMHSHHEEWTVFESWSSNMDLSAAEMRILNDTSLTPMAKQCLIRAYWKIDWLDMFRMAEIIMQKEDKDKDVCVRFDKDVNRTRQAWKNIFGATYDITHASLDPAVTYISQFTPDRLDRLSMVAQNWKGSISVAVYIPHQKMETFLRSFCSDPNLATRTNIYVHVTFEHGEFYPMNYLRNLALNNSHTSHVFLSDIDLVPMLGLEHHATSYLQQGLFKRNQALVVPCFEKTPDSPYPANKSHLLEIWDKAQIEPCQWSFKWTAKRVAQRATNYTLWRETSELYPIEWEEEYEPFIIMHRDDVPVYCENFVGRNRDKLAHLLEVFVKGTEFIGSGQFYTVHMPHRTQGYHNTIIKSTEYSKCSMAKYDEFRNYLEKKYSVTLTTPSPKPPSTTTAKQTKAKPQINIPTQRKRLLQKNAQKKTL